MLKSFSYEFVSLCHLSLTTAPCGNTQSIKQKCQDVCYCPCSIPRPVNVALLVFLYVYHQSLILHVVNWIWPSWCYCTCGSHSSGRWYCYMKCFNLSLTLQMVCEVLPACRSYSSGRWCCYTIVLIWGWYYRWWTESGHPGVIVRMGATAVGGSVVIYDWMF